MECRGGETSSFNPAVRSISEHVSLNGQVALVTGGTRGIGRSIAVALAEAGASVCVFARDPGRLADTERQIQRLGVPALTVAGDVADVDSVTTAVDRVTAELGPVDLLVNNAAVQTSIGDCAAVDPLAWWNDVTINLQAP
jgi:NAD(P)-dependent dehydrogenase (short-subunit alcohol dehydrogenase family)